VPAVSLRYRHPSPGSSSDVAAVMARPFGEWAQAVSARTGQPPEMAATRTPFCCFVGSPCGVQRPGLRSRCVPSQRRASQALSDAGRHGGMRMIRICAPGQGSPRYACPGTATSWPEKQSRSLPGRTGIGWFNAVEGAGFSDSNERGCPPRRIGTRYGKGRGQMPVGTRTQPSFLGAILATSA